MVPTVRMRGERLLKDRKNPQTTLIRINPNDLEADIKLTNTIKVTQ